MRFKFIILLFSYLIISPSACNSDKDIQPEGISPDNHKDLYVEWQEGKVLFKENCARCHGVFNKGKDSIPNFSMVQINTYTTHFLAHDKMNHAIMEQLSVSDFNKIMTFLAFLKRNIPRVKTQTGSPLIYNRYQF